MFVIRERLYAHPVVWCPPSCVISHAHTSTHTHTHTYKDLTFDLQLNENEFIYELLSY